MLYQHKMLKASYVQVLIKWYIFSNKKWRAVAFRQQIHKKVFPFVFWNWEIWNFFQAWTIFVSQLNKNTKKNRDTCPHFTTLLTTSVLCSMKEATFHSLSSLLEKNFHWFILSVHPQFLRVSAVCLFSWIFRFLL